MGRPVGVRVPPSAPSQFLKGIWLCTKFPFFMKSARVAKKWLVGNMWGQFLNDVPLDFEHRGRQSPPGGSGLSWQLWRNHDLHYLHYYPGAKPTHVGPHHDGCVDTKAVYSICIVEVDRAVHGIVRSNKFPAPSFNRIISDHIITCNDRIRLAGRFTRYG